jgi:TPR repeat protein
LRLAFRVYRSDDLSFRNAAAQGLSITVGAGACGGKSPAIVCLLTAIEGMRTGGKRIVILPPSYPERTVEVELASVETSAAAGSQTAIASGTSLSGCRVSVLRSPLNANVIEGRCLGHSFEPVNGGLNSSCVIRENTAEAITVANCVIDGALIREPVRIPRSEATVAGDPFESVANALKDRRQFALAYRRLELLASSGHAKAQSLLGDYVYAGTQQIGGDRPADWQTAMAWWTKAASQHEADAMLRVGVLEIGNPNIVRTEDSTREEPLRQAAQAGITTAQLILGACLEGSGQQTTYYPVSLNVSEAMYPRGVQLVYTLGCKQNVSQAVLWYEAARLRGEKRGWEALQRMGVKRLPEGGIDPFSVAYATARAGDMQGAFDLVKVLADSGNAKAQFSAGVAYQTGSVAKQDDAQAVSYFRRAADQGHELAVIELGKMIRDGRGTRKDPAQAMKLFRDLAAKGNAAAMYEIGYMYEQGIGIASDPKLGASWYQQASDRKNGDAQLALSKMYESGKGVPQDATKAEILLMQASRNGNETASLALTLRVMSALGESLDLNYANCAQSCEVQCRASSGAGIMDGPLNLPFGYHSCIAACRRGCDSPQQ